MLVGLLIIGDGSHTSLYSPPMPREGLAAAFSVDVTHKGGPGALTLAASIHHKDLHETTWSTAGSFSTIFSPGVATKEITGIKEQWRWVFRPSGSAGEFCFLGSSEAWRD